MTTCHHLGRPVTWEWPTGARTFLLFASKAPTTRATTGASSIAPTVLPQTGQNARHDFPDDRHVAGAPPAPVHSTAPRGNSTQATVSAPLWRWHILQEQVCGQPGEPVARNRIFPQRQPPSKYSSFGITSSFLRLRISREVSRSTGRPSSFLPFYATFRRKPAVSDLATLCCKVTGFSLRQSMLR